jgi:NADH dehydrogenase/NADH:ubiquinone oxidoreductase subunit G
MTFDYYVISCLSPVKCHYPEELIMPAEITLTIDGQSVTVPAGATLLQAARSLGIDIPTICLHKATQSKGLCRTCVVEVEGARTLLASCVAEARPDMVVHTRSERVKTSRRTILEMLASSIDLSEAPEVQAMMAEYQADPERFPGAVARMPDILDDNPMFIRDYAKCLLCWRCVQVCAEDAQYTYAINYSGRGYETQIGTFYDKPLLETTCVFCGQCIGVCPTNALKTRRQWLMELNT